MNELQAGARSTGPAGRDLSTSAKALPEQSETLRRELQ